MSGGSVEFTFRFPKYVWAPAGGWWGQNPNWRRNTKIAAVTMLCLCIPVFMTSRSLERRPIAPMKHIPSQYWCKHAKEDDPKLQ